MTWKTIRLELARTRDFPDGSVSRAYLIRIPLDEEGSVDQAAFEKSPARATVRRFWPSEADRSGRLVRHNGALAFQYDAGSGDAMFLLGQQPLRLGHEITVAEPDGSRLPFRVASIRGA